MSYRITVNHARLSPSINPDGTIDRLYKLMDACGIEEAVCFAPFTYQIAGKGIDNQNEWLARELKGRKRLHAFGTIDPQRDDLPGPGSPRPRAGIQGAEASSQCTEF